MCRERRGEVFIFYSLLRAPLSAHREIGENRRAQNAIVVVYYPLGFFLVILTLEIICTRDSESIRIRRIKKMRDSVGHIFIPPTPPFVQFKINFCRSNSIFVKKKKNCPVQIVSRQSVPRFLVFHRYGFQRRKKEIFYNHYVFKRNLTNGVN